VALSRLGNTLLGIVNKESILVNTFLRDSETGHKLLIQMDRDTIISLASLPDSRTRATVSGFFCEANGSLELVSVQSAGCSPEDRIVQGLVTKFINIAVTIAGDSESIDTMQIGTAPAPRLAAVG
jgi:hypothetical protein